MQVQSLPSVNSQFKNQHGDGFIVIGRGTQGIIIEYIDGRVELVSQSKWHEMDSAYFRTVH